MLWLAPEAAHSGAWTRAEGEGFRSQETRYFRTGGPAEERFEQQNVSLYFEYGIAEKVTIGAKIDQSLRLDDSGFGAQTGRIGGLVKVGVWTGEAGDVAAVEIAASTPLSGMQSPIAQVGDEADEFRASLLYGRGFTTEYGDAWAEGALGLAHLTGGRPDEVKLDLTAGVKPTEDWIAFAQIFGTFGLQNEDSIVDPDFDIVKLKLSIGYQITEEKTLLLGAARDIYTQGTDPGWEFSVTVWSPFDFDFGLTE